MHSSTLVPRSMCELWRSGHSQVAPWPSTMSTAASGCEDNSKGTQYTLRFQEICFPCKMTRLLLTICYPQFSPFAWSFWRRASFHNLRTGSDLQIAVGFIFHNSCFLCTCWHRPLQAQEYGSLRRHGSGKSLLLQNLWSLSSSISSFVHYSCIEVWG
jgi:hypothetical protein